MANVSKGTFASYILLLYTLNLWQHNILLNQLKKIRKNINRLGIKLIILQNRVTRIWDILFRKYVPIYITYCNYIYSIHSFFSSMLINFALFISLKD